ncbi:MAG TPA: alkene reductase [Azospira sp.]|nr:alkene reductase [Azospira sp.]HNN44971.1 alkene reductase [Azospira sp.]
MSHNDLFAPIRLGALTLPNRIVMAPLTRNRALPGNVPGPMTETYYRQRASAGLIITEASPVCAEGHGYPRTPGIHSAEQVAGWRAVTDAVHAEGGRIFLQLWHVGRISHPSLQPNSAAPVAPSALKPAGQVWTGSGLQDYVTPRALARDELPGIIAAYRQAALNAQDAGFDGVEVHGANGYLLDQFLRSSTNQRNDDYGGPIGNRARLLLEVMEAVIEVFGADRVGVRLSPENRFNDISDADPQATFGYVVDRLSPLGLAYLHVLEGDMTGQSAPGFDYAALRHAFAGPYMANCGYDRARAMAAVAAGQADLVAFGRAFIANPDLPARLAADAPLNEADAKTFYAGEEKGYIDYPALGG